MPVVPCLPSSHAPGYPHDPGPPAEGAHAAGTRLAAADGLPPRRQTPGGTAARNTIPVHKRIPYLPKLVNTGELAGQPRMGDNLNGAVFADPTGPTPGAGEQVVCRHLALGYIEDRTFLDRAAQNPRDLHDYYSNGKRETLQQRFDEWWCSRPEVQQVVGNRQFGHWLADIAEAMGREDKACAEALLISRDHAMAVRIQHKSRQGAAYTRVTCYDPNGHPPEGGTGNHMALEVNRPDELRKHAMEDFFTGLSNYFNGREADAACVAAICPGVPLPAARALPYLQQGHPKGALPPEHAAALFTAVRGNLREPLLALCELLASRGVTGSKALPALLRKDQSGSAAIHHAGDRKHPDVFVNFVKALEHLGVRGTQALRALLVKDRDGFSALHAAALQGHTRAFIDFAKALQRLGVRGTGALHALMNKDRNGLSALDHAVERHPDAFADFARAQQILDIRGTAPLLAPRSRCRKGSSALQYAATRRRPNTFVGFAEALQILGVRGTKALHALRIRDLNGRSALHYAVDNGYPDAFVELAQALQRLDIPGPDALPALLDKDRDGISALHIAAHHGHTHAFVDFARALVRLGIADDATLATPAAQDAQRALMKAAERKHPGAFVHFAEALQILGISGAQARRMLLAKAGNGTTTVDIVRRHKDPAQVKDLWDALAMLREPAA